MINLNITLMKKYFLLNTKHNVLYNITGIKSIVVEEIDIDRMFLYLDELIRDNKSNCGLYMIDTKDELLAYIVEFLYHILKVYISNFENMKEFKFFIYVNTSLFLTLFSQDALTILRYIPKYLKEDIDDNILNSLSAYIDSYDPRGLIFYLLNKSIK